MGFRFYGLQKTVNPTTNKVTYEYKLDKVGDQVKIFNNIPEADLLKLSCLGSSYDNSIPADMTSTLTYAPEFLPITLDSSNPGYEEEKERLSAIIKTEFDKYFYKLRWWNHKDVAIVDSTNTDIKATDIAFGTKKSPTFGGLAENIEGQVSSTKNIDSVYFLRPGVNLIAFKAGCRFEFFTDLDALGSLIVSEIDTIKSTTNDLGLNIDVLKYQWPTIIETNTSLKITEELGGVQPKRYNPDFLRSRCAYTLLLDLLKKDPEHNFYYNCPLQAATALDINTILQGEDAENLSQPKFWYDTNNINNKFVISQIDADYLDNGIVIAKASKLR
jgi:hypothetical protein